MSVFFSAVEAHVKWKLRLTHYIQGTSSETLDPAVIACDDRCDLGKWIYAHHDAFQHSATFLSVKQDHAEFHKTAAGIVELCHSGQQQMAVSNLNGHYARISRKVVTGIVRLGNEVEGNGVAAAKRG